MHTENILLVWKPDDTRLALGSYFDSAGYHVSCRDSLADALDLLGKEEFDVIITEEELPDGKAEALTGQNIPVVTLALQKGAETKPRKAFAMRLTAPIPEGRLLDSIEKVLRNEET